MRINVSGGAYEIGERETSGSVEVLQATDDGVIIHNGDVMVADASKRGQIEVYGRIGELAIASGCGKIYGHGNPEIIADWGGEVVIEGNPEVVRSYYHSSVLVFGEPANLRADNYGNITVATLNEDYCPENVDIGFLSSLRIIKPNDDLFEGSRYLQSQLERLFNNKDELEEMRLAYSGLLKYRKILTE